MLIQWRVSYGHDEPFFVCTHSSSVGDRRRNQAYLTGVGSPVSPPLYLDTSLCYTRMNGRIKQRTFE